MDISTYTQYHDRICAKNIIESSLIFHCFDHIEGRIVISVDF